MQSPEVADPSPNDPSIAALHSTRRMAWRFILLFVALMGLYYILTVTAWFMPYFMEPYLRLNARVSSAILSMLGQETTCVGAVISGSRFAVTIGRGCDAVDPSAVFVAAVFAFPASLRSKLPGAIAGTLLLVVLNLARIVGLFFTGVYYPRLFDTMHHDVGQALFIFLALALWILWAAWATRKTDAPAHAAA